MQTDHLWSKTCDVFRAEISEDVADSWLLQLRPVAVRDGALVVTGDERARSWVELRYGRALRDCAERAGMPAARVEFVDEHTASELPSAGSASEDDQLDSTDLNPRHRFEQFVIGRSNHIAHAAALAVAEQPAQAFNPLFIYGAPGVGKTHLLHSIGNFLQDQSPELMVRYMTAEDFATSFMTGIRQNTIGDFKTRLRSTDVLLVDDVQFLQSKVKTEEEFFHTFNALHESGRQLVISCDRTPRELEKVELRLRERFESGLVVEIEQPDHRLRSAILRQRVHHDNIPIADQSALDRIADRVPANVRSLEGALIRVSAFASMRREPVTDDLVDELLDALHPAAPRAERGSTTVLRVQKVIAEHFGLTTDQLLSKDRSRRISEPRQFAMYLCCELTNDSLPSIAGAFDRDHSTVVHARDKITELVENSGDAATLVDSLRRAIRSA